MNKKTTQDLKLALSIVLTLVIIYVIAALGAVWIDTHPYQELGFGSNSFPVIFVISIVWILFGMAIGIQIKGRVRRKK
jgi:hypothetical protein